MRWPFRRKRTPLSSMTDAELGALVRRSLGWFGNGRGGIKRLVANCAALYMVNEAVGNNAEILTVTLRGIAVADRDVGDWTIQAKRAGAIPPGEPPVTLGGWLKPGKVEEALACFDRLSTMVICMDDTPARESDHD